MISLKNYVITREVHRVAGARLYRGYRNSDRAPVIVKLPPADFPSPSDVAQIRYEYSVLKSLDLPGVVKALEIEKHDGVALILEGIAGEPLSNVLWARRLDLKASLSVAAAVAETLEAVHQNQIIHKNIQPQSIFLDVNRLDIKLIDFGIAACLSHENQKVQNPNSLEGTLAYISPEQTGRTNRIVDHRTDLYSLGVTLYEMLTGVLPFQATDPIELVHSHIARKPAPPSAVLPEIPAVVSDIVMKLLAKTAEDRYQGAHGVKADLEECLKQLDAAGQVTSFPLARNDVVAELRIPQKLYGRDAELSLLSEAWERTAAGATELFLVAGYSGIGKSALVHEIYASIVRRGAHFISGKFDQLNRNVPYAPIMHAFRSLIAHINESSGHKRESWKKKLLDVLGANAQVIIDVIPEVERLIGPQPSVQDLGPTESQNRFNLVFQSFLRVFATVEHPLVLFVDDLQWSDLPSLKLIRTILTEGESRYLLIIGAYRDNEVTASHPVTLFLSEVRKAGVQTNGISLQPLTNAVVRQIVADALCCYDERSAELAELVFEKTQGNPFFMNQLLVTMHKEKLITFIGPGEWAWDISAIREATTTDDVVAFMAHKIKRLSPGAQRILKLGACIGYQFDLRTSAIISEQSIDATTADLWEALRAGLIEATDPEYRFVGHGEDPGAGGEREVSFNVSYRFLHDRVQQAAYSLIDDGRAQEVHLRIGRLIQAKCDDADLFEVVNQVNMGAALVSEPRERIELAKLNLTAGKKAKAAAAYDVASGYFGIGRSLLDDTSWERQHELAFALCVEQAECEYMRGDPEGAESLFNLLLSHARTNLERVHIHNMRVVIHITRGKVADGVTIGLSALALLGIDLPLSEEDRGPAVALEHAELRGDLASVHLEDLLDAPEMSDHEKIAALKILANLTTPSWVVSPNLFALVSIHQVRISIRYGRASVSAIGFMAYGWYLAAMLGDFDEAYRYGRFALDLNERANNVDLRCKLNVIFGGHINFYRKHLRTSLEYLRRAYDAGLESGDLVYLSYRCTHNLIMRIGLSDELSDVYEDAERCVALMTRTKVASAFAIQTTARQVILNLMGRTYHRNTLSDGSFDEESFILERQSPSFNTFMCWYYVGKLQLAVLYEDYETALALSAKAEQRTTGAIGHFMTTELAFYTVLTLAALYPPANASDKLRFREMMMSRVARMQKWAESSPETFRHKHLLATAELARISGDEMTAVKSYEEAIDSAHAADFIRDEALGLELAARFHDANGRRRVARVYMTDAYYAYTLWGAAAKADHIAETYQHLLTIRPGEPAAADMAGAGRDAAAAINGAVTRPPSLFAKMGRGSRKSTSEMLDLMTVVKAAQTMFEEMVTDRLVSKLLQIIAENTGARKCALLLARGERLAVEAMLQIDPDVAEIRPHTPVDGSAESVAKPVRDAGKRRQAVVADDAVADARLDEELPAELVREVARSREAIVLNNAVTDARFGGELYITAHHVKSILCLPLVHQGKLTGVLYLENSLAAGAFPQARVELARLLASLAATAVENAVLYVELAASNVRLEQQVQERTSELRAAKEAADAANKAKTDFLSHMSHELRTPLNGILGYAQILERAQELSPGSKEGVHIIRKSGEHLLTLIDDALDLAKIEAGKMDLVPRPTHFPNIVQTVTSICRVRAEKKKISFSHEHIGPVLAGVAVDEKRLTQVLLNVLGNAIKVTDRGGVKFRVEVVDEPESSNVTVRFQIQDTGPGIAPEHLSRIFEPFEQVGDHRFRSQGTGLGLTITRKILEHMGGRIDVRSKLGKGSDFTVTVRITRVPLVFAPAEQSWEAITGYQGERRTVLVVDDDTSNRSIVRDLLTPLGFQVVEADCGERALSLAAEVKPDVIVLDMAMPDLDGFSTARRLRQMPTMTNTVIIASSASISQDRQRESLRAGCNSFVPKPVKAPVLCEALRQLLHLQWIYNGTPPEPTESPESGHLDVSALESPPPQVLARLFDLAKTGRIRKLLDEMQRLEEGAPQLGPWIAQVRVLAQSYQTRKLLEFFRAQTNATT